MVAREFMRHDEGRQFAIRGRCLPGRRLRKRFYGRYDLSGVVKLVTVRRSSQMRFKAFQGLVAPSRCSYAPVSNRGGAKLKPV